jgi:hypothetical protein
MKQLNQQQIIDLEMQLIEAIRTSNLIFLEKVLHDELLFLSPGGQVITKEMDLASHRAGAMVVERITPLFEDVHIIEDTATVIVVYDTRGTMLGNPIEGRFRYVRVWKKTQDILQVIAGSCIKLA